MNMDLKLFGLDKKFFHPLSLPCRLLILTIHEHLHVSEPCHLSHLLGREFLSWSNIPLRRLHTLVGPLLEQFLDQHLVA